MTNEAKVIDLEKSSIPNDMTFNLLDHYNIGWSVAKVSPFYRVVFTTIASILRNNQSKSNPRVGFELKDMKGDFKLGAIMAYHAPEEEDTEDKGNWTLEFTFNKEDMTDLNVVIDNHSDIFINCASRQAQSIMFGRFKLNEYSIQMFVEAIDTLVKFLDTNASDTCEVQVEYRGVFTASVAVENGEKVFSIIPGEIVRQIIKDDKSL